MLSWVWFPYISACQTSSNWIRERSRWTLSWFKDQSKQHELTRSRHEHVRENFSSLWGRGAQAPERPVGRVSAVSAAP